VTDAEMIAAIIRREGGFVDDPDDPGGATKFGITARTLSDWRNRPVTREHVQFLSEAEASEIYRDRYLLRPGIGLVEPEKLRAAVLDAAVQFGPRRAIEMLQRALGVKADGILGPLTREAMKNAGERAGLVRFEAERVRAYGRTITDNPKLAKFAAGWANRCAEMIEALA
jgi:lysozyme family protein